MPLTESCSLSAFDQNIRTELRAGRSPEQAAAIARDVLERACQREGKPVPTRSMKASSKPSRKRTREYLEAALEQARKLLPGWMYSVIHQAAMPSAGGRARANRRLEAMEKAWIEKASCSGMTNGELKDALYKMNVAFAAAKRQGKDTKALVTRSAGVVREMRKRGLATKGALVKACSEKTQKGFLYGMSEGGAHAHAINRRDSKSALDGAHGHVFLLPGEDMLVYTEEDGPHEHAIKGDGRTTERDGKHSHTLVLPSGRQAETSIDGAHVHALMIETTGFGAQHEHSLTLKDGTTIQSLNVVELAKRLELADGPTGTLPPASVIVSSMTRASALEHELHMRETMPLPEAVEMVSKGEPPFVPAEAWEVQHVQGQTVTVQLMGGCTMDVEKCAVQVEPGDIVDVVKGAVVGFSTAAVADDLDTIALKRLYIDEVQKATDAIPFEGPDSARIVFVGSAPSGVEAARRSPLVGPDAEVFEGLYLASLGFTRKDVGLGLARPVASLCEGSEGLWDGWLEQSLKRFKDPMVVALGKTAKDILGDRAAFMLPHPSAVRRFGHSGEVTRKMRAIAKTLDIPFRSSMVKGASRPKCPPSEGGTGATLAETRSELWKDGAIRCRVAKSAPEKKIVYGVVLDPYSVDLQNEWVPPATIEDSAHEFLVRSRVIGHSHTAKADAALVESWVEIYPSQKDRDAALENLPHRVFRRAFGDDLIHSGSWVAGVRLSDELWDQYQRGELGAFSVGGFSFKTKVTTEAMPDVEFVDIGPSS